MEEPGSPCSPGHHYGDVIIQHLHLPLCAGETHSSIHLIPAPALRYATTVRWEQVRVTITNTGPEEEQSGCHWRLSPLSPENGRYQALELREHLPLYVRKQQVCVAAGKSGSKRWDRVGQTHRITVELVAVGT